MLRPFKMKTSEMELVRAFRIQHDRFLPSSLWGIAQFPSLSHTTKQILITWTRIESEREQKAEESLGHL